MSSVEGKIINPKTIHYILTYSVIAYICRDSKWMGGWGWRRKRGPMANRHRETSPENRSVLKLACRDDCTAVDLLNATELYPWWILWYLNFTSLKRSELLLSALDDILFDFSAVFMSLGFIGPFNKCPI